MARLIFICGGRCSRENVYLVILSADGGLWRVQSQHVVEFARISLHELAVDGGVDLRAAVFI